MSRLEPEPRAVAADLRKLLLGEVLASDVERFLYAGDASVWEVPPLAVAVPRNADDVAAAVSYCAAQGLPIIPRGAATGLSGQAIGRGVVLDLSRHLRRVEPLGDGRYRVQPGVVLKALQAALAPARRIFPPDPSSGRMCTLGGMIANNAAGPHSVKYGFTADYVESLEVVLADGSRTTLAPVDLPAAAGSLADRIDGLLRGIQPLLHAHWPQVNKSSSGYDLPRAWSAERVDPTRLIGGSEGTLAVVVDAVLRTAPQPGATASALVAVAALSDVGELVNVILGWRPAALEILDRSLLRLLRDHEAPALRQVPGDPDAVLLVEFDGASAAEAGDGLSRLRAALDHRAGVAMVTAESAAEQQALWDVRNASSPILNRLPGRLKPITFVEDGVVLPERLPEYIAGLSAIFAGHQVAASIFGHAGNGHLHVKPVLNLRQPADLAKMEAIAEEVCDLLLSLRGSPAGEHGDGLARTPLLPRLFGPLYPLFADVKRLFDPAGVLNPGKIVATEPRRVVDQLRFDAATPIVRTGTVFDEPHWLDEMDKCHGCGTCRDYCPVFIATGEEAATARAKANLLRAVSRGALPVSALWDADFQRVMDLCVNCQLCLTECPTLVDIPGLARRARAVYVRHHGQSRQNRLLADSGRASAVGSALAPLSNVVLRSELVRGAMEQTVGIARRRHLPSYSPRPFGAYRSRFWDLAERKVVYFAGCWGAHNDADGEARAVVEVLEANGVAVHAPAGLRCCGIAKLTVGSEDEARRDAQANLTLLAPLVGPEVPLVASAASCGLALRADYLELLGEPAEPLAASVRDIHEYLLELHALGELDLELPAVPQTVAYHEPCHLKAQPAAGSARRLLELIPGVELVPISDSCCGIAGTFGMKEQHFDLSMRMGEPLFAALRQAGAARVATGCGTCQMQVTQGTGLPSVHPVLLLAEAYRRRG